MLKLKCDIKVKGINCSKSIIPIIAVANNDVMIKIADNSYPTVMRVDMIGTYISSLFYIFWKSERQSVSIPAFHDGDNMVY